MTRQSMTGWFILSVTVLLYSCTVFDGPIDNADSKPSVGVPMHIQTDEGRLTQHTEGGVLVYQFGRIKYGVDSVQSARFVPVLVDGQPMPPGESMYAMRVQLDPAQIELGKVYSIDELPPSFQLSWRESHAIPSGSGYCPRGVEINHERETICGLNWITHTVRGGASDAASLSVDVKTATSRRLSMVLEMDVFGKRLNIGDRQKLYCCSLATLDVDVSINWDGRFNANVDPFVVAYDCRFASVAEALSSGCTTIERD